MPSKKLETPEEKRARLDQRNAAAKAKKQAETPQEREERLKIDRERKRASKEAETENEAAVRRQNNSNCQKRRRLNMSPVETLNYRQSQAAREIQRRKKPTFGNIESWVEDEDNVEIHDCGKLENKCKGCQSLNFKAEQPDKINMISRCCKEGKIKLPDLQTYPDELKNLLTMESPNSKNFRTNIRSINNSFAFASMGANITKLPPGGPYTFRIQGQIYHRTGTLHPEPGQERKFAQLYVLDPSEATELRLKHPGNSDCNPQLMQQLAELMQQINNFAKSYRMLYDVEQEAAVDGFDETITMAIKNNRKADPRRYNAPTVSEVAIVFDNIDGEPPFERDILIYPKHDPFNPGAPPLKRINILDPNLDAFTYPLLFPYGEQTWGPDLPRESGHRSRISQMEYYSHRLSVRESFNPILHAGKLTQQYIVDSYVKTEGNRLNYHKTHQPELRVDKYKGFVDYVQNSNGELPGNPVILPSTFEGSPRNYQQRYQDAMAIVTKFGKPDFFITMTCNPKWPEITNNIELWENPEDRPDIVSRVFNIKKNSLLKELETGLFGEPVALIHVIEFQKRGLPHAHILLTVKSGSKPKTQADIDKYVSAEIPDIKYSNLREKVLKHMVHGPCGRANPKCPCMIDGQCSKQFPKQFQTETIAEVNGYPIYRRRQKIQAEVNGKVIDNQWIVPYNPYLILRYNCHINVEVCASIKSVKYLFKYVYKGHDAAQINVKTRNEILDYVDGRYVSAPEGIWRLFGFKMHKQSHAVMRLDVHLPGEQSVFFNAEKTKENPTAALNNAERKRSTLQAWFELNQCNQEARKLNYWEIPTEYCFKTDCRDDKNNLLPYQWVKRTRAHNTIGRMYNVGINDSERYYLRLLLLHIKGVTGWSDLLTCNGVLCETFRESARLHGLLLDDLIWEQTIEEAIVFQLPYQLRQLFAYICLFCSPTEPEKLWNNFRKDFIEDFCHRRHPNTTDCLDCEQYALKCVKDVYLSHGRSCAHIKLPFPADGFGSEISEYDIDTEVLIGAEMHLALNLQQRIAFDAIMSAVKDTTPSAKCFFVDGPGGSGKTFLYNTLMHCIRGEGSIVLPVATTGVAANLLNGGRTMHSQFGLPLELNESSVSRFSNTKKEEAKLLIKAKLLLIDECTMASCHAVNVIDNLLRELMKSVDERNKHVPFGGKPILFGGDFRQCLTVVPHAQQSEIVQNCIKKCKSWPKFKFFSLTSNMRSEDPNFSEWLLKLGDGTLTNEDNLDADIIEIPRKFITSGDLVDEIFGEDMNSQDFNQLSNRAILTPKNDTVDKINDEIVSKLDGELITYVSTDEAHCDDPADANNFPVEFLNSLTPSGMSPHKLNLKVNTIVILLRNLDTKRGLCNGTRLLIKELKRNVIVAKILTGSGQGNVELIPRIILDSTRSSGIPFQLRRRQFPVKPAFAMTINKAQGQTLEKVGILLPEPIFGHGQLYVAFSRVKRAENVRVKIFDTAQQGKLLADSDRVFTRNIVYREIL